MNFHAFFANLGKNHPPYFPIHISTEAEASEAINLAMGFMYSSGFFIAAADAQKLGRYIYKFLSHYAILASLTLTARKQRFPMTPKVHMLAHAGHDLISQGLLGGWAMNPAAFTNSVQEDFIGKPSRLSRRVNVKAMARNVLMRRLISYHQAFRRSDADLRGLDGYEGR